MDMLEQYGTSALIIEAARSGVDDENTTAENLESLICMGTSYSIASAQQSTLEQTTPAILDSVLVENRSEADLGLAPNMSTTASVITNAKPVVTSTNINAATKQRVESS